MTVRKKTLGRMIKMYVAYEGEIKRRLAILRGQNCVEIFCICNGNKEFIALVEYEGKEADLVVRRYCTKCGGQLEDYY